MKSQNKLKSSIAKLRITLYDLELRKVGVKTTVEKINNQLSYLGLAIAETNVHVKEFQEFMEAITYITTEISLETISQETIRDRLLELSKSKLFAELK